MSENIINMLDSLLIKKNYSQDPASFIKIRERLMPARGMQSSVAAAQYPASTSNHPDSFRGGAGLVPKDGGFDVIIDGVASSANRRDNAMNDPESPELNGLLPRVLVRIGVRDTPIFEAPHRIADASLRLNTRLGAMIDGALQEWRHGNAAPLARLDPSSIVGGCWDSRGQDAETGVKMGRLMCGEVIGYDAHVEPSMSVYTGSIGAKVLNHELGESGQISSSGHGRAISVGKPTNRVRVSAITATTILSLDPIRTLRARARATPMPTARTEKELQEDLALQRYILGIGLVKALIPTPSVLRSGCELVQVDADDAYTIELLFRRRGDKEGNSDLIGFVGKITLDWAIRYCAEARAAFGVHDFSDPFIINTDDITESASKSGKAKVKKQIKREQIVAETTAPVSEAED